MLTRRCGISRTTTRTPISGAPTPNSPTGRGGRHLTADQRSGVSSVQSALNYIHCQACGHYVHMPSRRHRHHQRIPCARGYGRTAQLCEASPGLKTAPVRPRTKRGRAGTALTANRTAGIYVCTHLQERMRTNDEGNGISSEHGVTGAQSRARSTVHCAGPGGYRAYS